MANILNRKLMKAFVSWIIADNDDKKAMGACLEKYTANLPKEFKTSPSNSLYRCILVSDKALVKVRKGKPLVLKNRKYSSWTYDLQEAKNFSKKAAYWLDTFEKTFIILKKDFPNNQIILNAEAFGSYLSNLKIDELKPYRDIDRLYNAMHMAKIEKEIVVRNISDAFILMSSDIPLYKVKNEEWKAFT